MQDSQVPGHPKISRLAYLVSISLFPCRVCKTRNERKGLRRTGVAKGVSMGANLVIAADPRADDCWCYVGISTSLDIAWKNKAAKFLASVGEPLEKVRESQRFVLFEQAFPTRNRWYWIQLSTRFVTKHDLQQTKN
ncbi:hypothetical protein PoB_000300500 [Plakobranchus ocellatus]|uniref:Uncharacterized protein n=1 Tax=Plakobranchus ocellatus TaxID=259542 RepID=A0AAV3Y0R9_9GAST|nr:hypothetical protein PoB_000300500 [Plakobranchus ocellatus]